MATRRQVAITVALALFVMLVVDQAIILGYASSQSNGPVLRSEPFWAGIVLGVFTSQLTLAVAYAALGDGPSARRVLFTAFVVASFAATLSGTSGWWFDAPFANISRLFLATVLFFFLFQLPLWGLRFALGWIITSPWSTHVRWRAQFSLAQLLAWSAFFAVPLCILEAIRLEGKHAVWELTLMLSVWTIGGCGAVLWILRIALSDTTSLWFVVFPVLLAMIVQAVAGYVSLGRLTHDAVLTMSVANLLGTLWAIMCLKLAFAMGFRLSVPTAATKPAGLAS